MNPEKSIKTRVRDVIVFNAEVYHDVFVEYDYLLFSDAFVNNDYYIVSACADNYKHLTGVHSEIPANEFFDKCMNSDSMKAMRVSIRELTELSVICALMFGIKEVMNVLPSIIVNNQMSTDNRKTSELNVGTQPFVL